MTAGMLQYAISSSPIILAASWVNVPLGPKNEIDVIFKPPKNKKKSIVK
jgi:hypothetical protein